MARGEGRRARRAVQAGGTWLAAALSVLPAVSNPAAAQQAGRDSTEARAGDGGVAPRRAQPGLGDLSLLGRSLAHVVTAPARWDADEWMVLPAAATGLVLLSSLDAPARDFMRENQGRGADRVADRVKPLGTVYNYRVLAGFYAAGLLLRDDRSRMVAVEGIASSAIAAGLITPAIQAVMGRSRPWTDDGPYTLAAFSRNISFPSGHTTHAFAVASVIATEYDALWVKGLAYGVAGVVGLSRMYHDAHYLSDVTAGALIGTLVGRSVARFAQDFRGGRLSVSPAVTADGQVGLSVRF